MISDKNWSKKNSDSQKSSLFNQFCNRGTTGLTGRTLPDFDDGSNMTIVNLRIFSQYDLLYITFKNLIGNQMSDNDIVQFVAAMAMGAEVNVKKPTVVREAQM